MAERELTMVKVNSTKDNGILKVMEAIHELAKEGMREKGKELPDDQISGEFLIQALINVVVNVLHMISLGDNGVYVAQMFCTEVIQGMRDVQTIEKMDRDNGNQG